MARNLFGGTSADVAEDIAGARVPGAVGTVWDGPSEGANQVTDLTDTLGASIEDLTSDDNGMIAAFYGPDNEAESLYVDFGGGKVRITSVDLGERFNGHVTDDDPHGSKAAALAEFEAQKGQADGIATLDQFGFVHEEQLPAIAKSPQMVDWISVKAPPFNAEGDGTSDDTDAIQTAINAAGIGGVVYFPKGVYRTSAPLDLPKGVTLMGSHSNLMVGPGMGDDDFACYIQALPSFTGSAMIQIIGDNDGTHPAINGEQRITGLMLDGSKMTTGSVDGIYAKGNVQNVVLRDVCIRKMTNNGIITGSNAGGEWPYSWRLHSVMVDNCKANGIVFERQTDLSLIDVQVIGSWATGIRLINSANSILSECRAEWNGGYGFHLTGAWGNWPGSGAATMSGCSTDRNGWDGTRIDATGNGAFLVQGLMARRDGRNGGPGGGGYAGLALLNQAPVVVTGLTNYVGTDDAGTANTSPDYGVSISGARDVQLDNAYLHGFLGGLRDDGTNQRITVGTITTVVGNNYAEDRIVSEAAVTVNGSQTITGDKTFTGLTTITGLPAQDLKYAVELTGSSGSNVSLGAKTYLDGSKPFTFGTWVDFYSNALTDDGAVWAYGYSSGNDKGYAARVDGSTKRLQFFWGAATNVATASNIYCYGKMWLVLTYDGVSTLKVYKNNILMDTLTIASRNADATVGSYLGTRDGTARNLNGALDDSFLYSRVLTTAELTAIFRTATFPSNGNLFRYRFDERTGTTATDSSGSGNNGTINSGTYRVSEFGNPNRAPSAPTTWQASLANADLRKTAALFIGSSTTQGANSTTLDNRFTDVFGQLIHRQFNGSAVPGGKHVRAADTGWTTTGTAVLNGDGLGLGSYALSAGATLSRTLTSCTGFDLHFVQGPGQGTFTYQIDGGAPVTVTPSTTGTANRHDGNVTVTGLTLGSHTLQINAANACIVNGLYVHNGDATLGVRVYNSGKGGTATADFVTANAGTIWQRAAAIGNVNLVAVMLGSNDFSGSINPSIFKANLLTLIHSVWNNLSTRPDIVLINSYKRYDHVGYGTTYLYGQYGAKMQELANELDGVLYVDQSGLFPLMNDSVHDPLDLMHTDNIHMNDAGHRYMARLLMRSLVPSIM